MLATVKLAVAAAALLLCAGAQAVPLAEVIKDSHAVCVMTGDGRSQLVVQIENRAATRLAVEVPAGVVVVGQSGARACVIRGATLEVEPGKVIEATLPAVPLSPENTVLKETLTLTTDQAPELKPLLDYSEAHNDLPRPTAQVVALLLRGNVTYSQWVAFLRRDPGSEVRPTPADVVAAVDGLAIARQLQPKREFALYQDGDLRLRAIRNPWSRAKAMQLFAMAAPEGVVVPDIGQLLHSKPGDNCPICRLRGKAEEQAGNGF